MPDRPIAAYPGHYAPSDLNLRFTAEFTRCDGTVCRPPGMQLTAGDGGTWTFRFENRHADLHAGAVLTLVRFNYQIAYHLQTRDPRGRDYCTLETDSGASLRFIALRDAVNLFSIVVESGVFKKGETCTVRIGDRRGGSIGSEVFWSATDAQFLLAVDPDGNGAFRGVSDNPFEFSVVAHPEPDLLRLLGPTVAATGEPFRLHLGVFDPNRNLVDAFDGAVAFEVPPGIEGLPAGCRFTPKESGLKILQNVRAVRPGVYRIGVRLEDGSLHTLGNPTVVEDTPEQFVYWGDVHAHGWGDSTMHLMHLRTDKLDPFSRHRQGRRVGRFDFACPAAMSMDPEKREEVWEAYRDACRRMDEPGTYVPFLAYEAHPAAGDRQVIFRDYETEPIPPSMRAPMEEVDRAYGRRDDVLLQVHIGGAPPRWDAFRPARERFLEACSGFGCAEWLLQHALRLGYRPGVCGASDLHLGLMGGPRAVEPFRGRFGQKYPMCHRDAAYGTGPVTAVVAPRLDRESLWNAIEARRTYATSGARIYLRLTCNGVPAGSDLPVEGPLRLSLICHGAAPIERIDLIVGESRVKSWSPGELDFSEDLTLSPDELPGRWLYARVQQTDDEYAWSSPIYLRRSGPVPSPGDLPAWNDDGPADRDAAGENSASRYLPDLKAYLEREENPDRFHDLTPIGLREQSMGRCALFSCLWSDERLPMSIRWFYEFDIPKIRFDLGWRDYGAFDENDLGPRFMEKYR